MSIPEQYRLKNTIKYPTSVIVGGLTRLGFELADSLIEQGGYVIIVDSYTPENIEKLKVFPKETLVSFLDYTSIPHLEEEIRRLDYVFYFAHDSIEYTNVISTQDFLNFSNYLDTTLALASKFQAKFLLTTAIRAHQLAMPDGGMDANYGINATTSHTVYTDMEIQRYAESLVMEYTQKISLDVRIVRLGELIGDGIDFSRKSNFIDLILSSVKGGPIKLRKDGLEQEWYVHVLDCAYGIIKAQFSQGTAGKIFSIAYDHPFTHLSIAYKIQEAEDEPKEIQFLNERDNLPSIKLYKPAPNLSKIGWTPRVSFDRAINQSLAAAKIYLLEQGQGKGGFGPNDDKNVVGKLKNFLTIAKTNEVPSESGPVSRLVEERRKVENVKRDRIGIANQNIKRKSRKPRTVKEKVQSWFWNNFIGFVNIFTIFKNKSPLEVGILLIFFGIFIFLFVTLVSPALLIAKNGFIVYSEYRDVNYSAENGDWDELRSSSKNIEGALKQTSGLLDNYTFVTSIIALDDDLTKLTTLIDSYALYVEGLNDIGFSLEPMVSYSEGFSNNTQVRAGSDTYLSTKDAGVNFEDDLLELDSRSPFLQVGLDKVNNAYFQLSNSDLNFLPSYAVERIIHVNSDLRKINTSVNSISYTKYLPEIVGVGSTKTYLVLVLDNTRQMPVGGEVSAYALLTVQNGSLSDVKVQSIDEVNFDFSSIDDSQLDKINNRKFTLVNKTALRFNDLGNVREFDDFAYLASTVFADTNSININGVIAINMKGLEKWLEATDSFSNKDLEVDGVKIQASSFLSDIGRTQATNGSLQSKHRVLAQVLAFLINSSLDDPDVNLIKIQKVFSEQALQSNIMMDAPDLKYSELLKKNNVNGVDLNQSDSYYSVGVNTEDLREVSVENYPPATLSTRIEVDDNLNLKYNLGVVFSNIGSTQEVSVCLPLYVDSATISVENIPKERFVINSDGSEKCVVAKVLTEDDMNVAWSVNGRFAVSSGNAYPIDLALTTVKGSQTRADYEIRYSNLKVTDIDNSLTRQTNSLLLTNDVFSDKLLKVTFQK